MNPRADRSTQEALVKAKLLEEERLRSELEEWEGIHVPMNSSSFKALFE